MNEIKSIYLEKAYDSIHFSYIQSYLLGLIFNELAIDEAAPCAPNFRDSLFHFSKLYNSDFNIEYIGQCESIIEHTNRLYKDSIVRLTHVAIHSLSKLIEENSDIALTLYDFKNALKRIQLDLRFQALNISRPLDKIKEAHKDVDIINEIVVYLKSTHKFERFKELNSKYGKL